MLDPSEAVFREFGSRCIRCAECKKSFRPHPRLKARQKTCTQRACQLAYRARYRKQYRRENAETEKDSQEKVKSNRASGFWKSYRKSHPQSSERNRAQTKLHKRLRQAGLQRQLDIVQVIDPPGYFDLFQGFATSHRSLLLACQATRAA
jgi:hypothetical protein